MDTQRYAFLKRKIVPQLRFNQEFYEEAVGRHISAQTVWLDAGCGKHVLPPWRAETERNLVARARLAIGCDADHEAIRKHCTLSRLVACDLAQLPMRSASVNLITCNMVVEHLERPIEVFGEFARILKPGGRVIIHTPNLYSHFVLGSRLIPKRLKPILVKALDGRKGEDVFPTRYCANTPARLQALMTQVGLTKESFRMLASEAALQATHPILAVPELLYIRLTLRPSLKLLRASILATFLKTESKSS